MRALVRFATSSMKEALLEANMRGVRLTNPHHDPNGGIFAITSPVTHDCLSEWLGDKNATLVSAYWMRRDAWNPQS